MKFTQKLTLLPPTTGPQEPLDSELQAITKERDDLRAWVRRDAAERAEFDAVSISASRMRDLEQALQRERDRSRDLEQAFIAEQGKVAHLVEELRSLQLDKEWARLLCHDRVAPPTELRRRAGRGGR